LRVRKDNTSEVKRTTRRESLERIRKCHGKIEKKMIKNLSNNSQKNMVKIERMAEKNKIRKRES
jgi:hypothetical protein